MPMLSSLSNGSAFSSRGGPLGRPARSSSSARRILIVGTGALGRATAEDVASPRARVVGFLSWEGESSARALSASLLGSSDQLAACLAQHAIDEVYIAAASKHHGNALDAALQVCEELAVPFAVPAVPFRLTRGQARAAKSFPDGYVHFAFPRAPVWAPLVQSLRDVTARAIAACVATPFLVLFCIASLLTVAARVPPHGTLR